MLRPGGILWFHPSDTTGIMFVCHVCKLEDVQNSLSVLTTQHLNQHYLNMLNSNMILIRQKWHLGYLYRKQWNIIHHLFEFCAIFWA